jgi:hypothetical protein
LHNDLAKTIISGGSIAMRSSVFIAGLVALSLGGAPALAFQEMPEPPPADVPAATPQVGPLQLGTPGGGAAPETEEGGLSMFGYTVLPKFDFGLDVMYGKTGNDWFWGPHRTRKRRRLHYQQVSAASRRSVPITINSLSELGRTAHDHASGPRALGGEVPMGG